MHSTRCSASDTAYSGSAARGELSPGSDVDILVVFDALTFDRYMDVKFLLEDSFGRQVDLVMEDTLKPRIKPRILSEVVYAEGSSAVY